MARELRVSIAMRGAFVIVLFAACGRVPPKQTEFPTLSPDDTYNVRVANLRTTLGRAGIKLKVAGFDDSLEVDCDSADKSDCLRCDLAGERTPIDGAVIDATTRAFQLYPTNVLVAAKIDHVAVCHEIWYPKSEDTHPAGVAIHRTRGLLISVKYFLERSYSVHNDFTIDNIAHHEVFHLLEHEHMPDEARDDPEWQLANPEGFEYDPKAKRAIPLDGFVNAYAMTAAKEDKASVYEFLLAKSPDLCNKAGMDEVIRRKAKIIWRRVARVVGTDAFMRAAAPCVDWI